jgi:UDP-N-acetyl-D-mannosaminuronic acid dehydrogenase
LLISELQQKIESKNAKLAVIGLGYVGLPVAALFARRGFAVTGVDLKADRVALINQSVSPIEGDEPGLAELIAEVVKSGKLHATTDYEELKDCDVVLVDVETPVNHAHIPEYEALRSALKSLSSVMKEGALVVIESTIMPGTMQNVVLPILEEITERKCGQGFYLGNCPERVMPGKLLKNLNAMSRVVGGDSPETAAAMRALYGNIVASDLDTADWITAELVKTVENTYRDVQIAFANETAMICEALGADVWRVRELVRKSPGREMLLPGAGVGGHCIPKDPWLLASSVKGLDVRVRLIPAARDINSFMPTHMLDLLKTRIKELSGKHVLVLGYSYLENSDDTRDTPSQYFIKALEAEGGRAVVHDPYVAEFAGDLYEMAQGCDAAVLITAHAQYRALDFAKLKAALKTPILVDGRNLWDKMEVSKAGLDLIRLGDFSL